MTNANQQTFDVTNPFDESIFATVAETTEAQAFDALECAVQLYRNRDGWLGAQARIEILKRFAGLVTEQTEALALQAAREGGKPLKDSLVEIRRAIQGVEVAIEEIGKLHGTEVPMGLTDSSTQRFAHTFREPRGVVLAVSAFNHPFNLIIHQAITAVAAGCPVLVKPSRDTPLSAISVVNLLHEAGLPRGWCELITCADEVTTKIICDCRVSFLTFIGSSKVGWYLRSKLAAGATCALEHGGAAPVIIDATADVKDSIPLLVRGGFYHAGQVCVSVQRIYVHEKVATEFANDFVAAAEQLITGDQLNGDTDVGPLIRPQEVERVHAWVQEAVQAGATLLCGGRKISATTYAPTVLWNPPESAQVSQKEIFGPVVAIYTFENLDDAIARANRPDLFFQASIFTRDLNTALLASRRLHGMAVMVNDHSAFRVDWMPFGGHRQSGLGIGGIGHSMKDMTLERMVVFRSSVL
ncbi:MAG: aldehyde dehydrogenase family protein [Planctomycetota bacterium]